MASRSQAAFVRELVYQELNEKEEVRNLLRLVIDRERAAFQDGAGIDDWCVAVILNSPLPPDVTIEREQHGVTVLVLELQPCLQANVASPA